MRIRKLRINGFGKFENREFVLKPGMNVFYGRNESGKSTLQSFIKGMLFGLKGGRRGKDGTPAPVRQYKPWNADAYAGTLEYELDNGETYSVVRTFDRNTVTVYDRYSNNITGSFPAGRDEGVKFAEQHLGLSEGCFERTVFIGQMQSVLNSEGKRIIAERLTNVKQTGDEEVSFRKAIDALKDAQLKYVGSERTTTRPLNIINSLLEEAAEQEKEYTELHKNNMDMFFEQEQLQKKEAELKSRLNDLNLLRERLVKKLRKEELGNICSSLDRCRKELALIESSIEGKRKELDDAIAELKKYEAFESFSRNDSDEMVSDYTNYRHLRRDIEELESELRDIEEKIGKFQEELHQYRIFEDEKSRMDEVIQDVLQYSRARDDSTDGNSTPRSWLKKYISLAGLVTGIIVILLSFLITPPNTVAAALGLATAVLSGAFFIVSVKHANRQTEEMGRINLQKQKHLENERLLNSWMEQVKVDNIHDFIRLRNLYEDRKSKLQDLVVNRQKLNDSWNNKLTGIREYENRIRGKLTSANIDSGTNFSEEDIMKWREGLETRISLGQAVKDIETWLSSLEQKRESLYREASVMAGRDIDLLTELEQEIQARTAELEELGKEQADEAGILEDLTPEGLELETGNLNEKIAGIALRINTLSTRLENTPDGDMVQKAHERVRMLEQEKQKKLFLGKALETAMEVLTEASLDIQRDYSPYLNEAMSSIIAAITGGRYNDVMADDSLTLNIQTPDTAEKVIPEQLSSGTADQVYFALRLATVKLVEKDGETLPLFLDEPFAQYDEERTKNALLMLKNESDNRQIILFTCKNREVELVRQIFGDNDINVVNL